MTSTLHSLSHAALELQGSTGDAAGQNLSLFVEELLEEFGIFVVDILDTALLETAVLLLLDVNGRGSQVANFRCLCHGLVLLFVRTTLCGIFSSKFVEFYSKKADNALVATETDFQFFNNGGVSLELQQLIETGALLVDGISQLLEAPVLFIDNLSAVGSEDTLEFFDRLLHLNIRQNGSEDENGLILIHHRDVIELSEYCVYGICDALSLS